MKLLIIQNQVKETIDENLEHLHDLLSSINDDLIDFIIFPEMFTTPYQMSYFKKNKQSEDGAVIQFLKETATSFHAYVVGGSLPEFSEGKLYNTAYIINTQGHILTKYRKKHLFSVTYPNGESFDESLTLTPGKETITFHTEFGTMGVMICFDVRFPMLARDIQKMGAKVIFVPAAFNTFTGPLHWHTTFRARAIDHQVFLVAASPSRNSFGDYEPYGHSLLVDPWGKIIHELDEKESYMLVDIDLEEIDKVRTSIPIVRNDKD